MDNAFIPLTGNANKNAFIPLMLAMELVDLLGFIAAIGTTGAFVPQVLKSWKTQSVKDFSWAMLALFFSGVLLWIIYGLLIGNLPLIAANAISALLVLVLIAIKIRGGS